MHRALSRKTEHKISLEELHSLRLIKKGAAEGLIPLKHRERFRELGWVEQKYGGMVLTSHGRYQLAIRARETGLSILSLRYLNRAEELRTIANTMTTGQAPTLHQIAKQWEAIAAQLTELERLELSEPLLG